MSTDIKFKKKKYSINDGMGKQSPDVNYLSTITSSNKYYPKKIYHNKFSPNKQMPNKHQYIKCGNCGIKGHIYSTCRLPKLSYGIILFNNPYITDKYCNHILLIRRKDSLTYIEFIRGKYNINDKSYLQMMFNRMTVKEHNRILNNGFLHLWNKLWLLDQFSIPKKFTNEYRHSNILFDKLKKGFLVKCPNINGPNINGANIDNFNVKQSNIFISISMFIKNVSKTYTEPEWGFPKGRRNYDERDIDVSIREFEEETNINKENIKLFNNLYPFSEEFFGSNNIKYKHIYYLAKLDNPSISLYIDKNKKDQVTEISDIKWFNKADALSIIRSYENNKTDLINKIFKFIDNYKDFCGEY
jgi:8-oxo-dGTP pyrophosphatase MutT (NUDIX family)